jgi:FkbH-like protein
MKKKILTCIFNSLDTISEHFKTEKSLSSPLFRVPGGMDSLSFVMFLVGLEEEIEKILGMRLTLADEKSIQREIYPFSTVDTLFNYIEELLSSPNKQAATAKKIIIVDLDNTLWEGVLGEDGPKNVKVYGKYLELQKNLKLLKNNGVLLAISSKNDAEQVFEVFQNHSDMVLNKEDFILHKINWNSKSLSIKEIIEELNIGVDSVVFIDDDPHERDVVKKTFPEIISCEILDMGLFCSQDITQEDKYRMQMYVTEKDRKKALDEAISIDTWIKDLGIEVIQGELNLNNMDRVVQLFNKTNQMNMSSRRLTKDDLLSWIRLPCNRLKVFYVHDKFGDSGLVGVLGFTLAEDRRMIITDFILSCRVIGRKIEETIFYAASKIAEEQGYSKIVARYIPTDRNKPCEEFLNRLNGEREGNEFSFYMKNKVSLPEGILLSLSAVGEVYGKI